MILVGVEQLVHRHVVGGAGWTACGAGYRDVHDLRGERIHRRVGFSLGLLLLFCVERLTYHGLEVIDIDRLRIGERPAQAGTLRGDLEFEDLVDSVKNQTLEAGLEY